MIENNWMLVKFSSILHYDASVSNVEAGRILIVFGVGVDALACDKYGNSIVGATPLLVPTIKSKRPGDFV